MLAPRPRDERHSGGQAAVTSRVDAEQLQRRMNEVRLSLRSEAEEVADNASELADWRYYIRTHPWASFAVVAAVGYLVVPKSRIARRARALSRGAGGAGRDGKEQGGFGEQQRGALGTVAAFVGPILLRAGTTYLTRRLSRAFGDDGARAPQVAPRRDEIGQP